MNTVIPSFLLFFHLCDIDYWFLIAFDLIIPIYPHDIGTKALLLSPFCRLFTTIRLLEPLKLFSFTVFQDKMQ